MNTTDRLLYLIAKIILFQLAIRYKGIGESQVSRAISDFDKELDHAII